MNNIKLDGAADDALSKLQNTTLTPMEEALFQAWTKANQIKKPDAPNDVMDYRGVYKNTNGTILPHGELQRISAEVNDSHKLEQALRDRLHDRLFKQTEQGVKEIDSLEEKTHPHTKPYAGEK